MRPNNYKAYAWLGIALSLLLVGALQVQGEAGHDEEAASKQLLSEVGALRKDLEAKTREIQKLLDKVESLQGEKSSVIKQVDALKSASKEGDSSARSELATLKLQLQKKQEQLAEHQSTCSANQDKVEEAQKHVDRISDELAAVRKAAKKLEEDGVLTSKRDKASLDELRQHLASARQEADASKSQLQEATVAAAKTMEQLNEILGAWLPVWLSKRYNQAGETIKPHLDWAWEKSSDYATYTSEQSQRAYELSKTKAADAWEAASPSIQGAYATSERAFWDSYASSKKFATPHLETASKHGKRYWLASKLHLQTLSRHPQLVKLRRQIQAQQAAIEKLIAKQLRQIPALKPYAKQPYLAYITYGLIVLPISIILLPIYLLTGKSKQKQSARPAASAASTQDLPGGVITGDGAAASSSSGPKARKAKGKRIVEGDEGIHVP